MMTLKIYRKNSIHHLRRAPPFDVILVIYSIQNGYIMTMRKWNFLSNLFLLLSFARIFHSIFINSDIHGYRYAKTTGFCTAFEIERAPAHTQNAYQHFLM